MTRKEKFIKIIEFMSDFPEDLHMNGRVIGNYGGHVCRSIEGMLPLIFPEFFHLRKMSFFNAYYPIYHKSNPEDMQTWDEDVNDFLEIHPAINNILFNCEDNLDIAVNEAAYIGVPDEELEFTFKMEDNELGPHAMLEDMIQLWESFYQLNVEK